MHACIYALTTNGWNKQTKKNRKKLCGQLKLENIKLTFFFWLTRRFCLYVNGYNKNIFFSVVFFCITEFSCYYYYYYWIGLDWMIFGEGLLSLSIFFFSHTYIHTHLLQYKELYFFFLLLLNDDDDDDDYKFLVV